MAKGIPNAVEMPKTDPEQSEGPLSPPRGFRLIESASFKDRILIGGQAKTYLSDRDKGFTLSFNEAYGWLQVVYETAGGERFLTMVPMSNVSCMSPPRVKLKEKPPEPAG